MQCYHSLANSQLFNRRFVDFFSIALIYSQILRSWSTIFTMTQLEVNCYNLEMPTTSFCANSFRFINKYFNFVYHQEVGLEHRVQFSQLHHSMTNFNVCKCLLQFFAVQLLTSKNHVKVTEYNTSFSGKCQNLQTFSTHVSASSNRFRDIKSKKIP